MRIKRIYTLDFVKFIAACCIVCHHYQQLFYVKFSVFNFYEGNFGFHYLVELFFIISGFVVAKSNSYSVGKSKEYFLHVIYRIYPMAMIATTVTALLEYGYFKIYNEFFWDLEPSLWRLFNSLLLTFSGGPVDVGLGIINPLWFICVLLFCHVLYCFTTYISTKNKYEVLYLQIICIFIGESMLHYGINLPFYNDTMGRGVSAFFVGVVLYKIWKNNNSAKVTTVSIIALAIVILTYKFEYNLYADGQRGVLTYIAFPSLIILLSNIDSIIPRVLGKIFVFLGGVSYEMFLWHFPGILLIDFLNRGRFMIDRNSPKTMLIFLLVVISFSTIEYLFIEKPIGKKLSGSR